MNINTSVYTNYNNNVNQTQTNNTLERIATGLAINKAADDGSGLAIANQLLSQADSYGQSIQNGNSGVAMMQLADSALGNQSDILNQITQKMSQAATATTSDEGRAAILKDVQGLMKQFNDISSQTNYNGTTLLQQSDSDMAASNSLDFQMGAEAGDNISMDGIQSNSQGVGLDSLLTETATTFTAEQASNYLETLSNASDSLNDFRSDIASTTNQLESSIRNLMTQQTNTQAASSVIMDTDYAAESSNFNKQNIISQIGSYTMSQANATQNNVMRLLQ